MPTQFLGRKFLLILILFGAGAFPVAAAAERDVHITVTVNGKKTLSNVAHDDGKKSKAELWRSIHDVGVHTVKGAKIDPEDDEGQVAVVEGDIEVAVEFVGSVKVKKLTLQRENAMQDHWHIVYSEVEEMADTLGLPRIDSGGSPNDPIPDGAGQRPFPWLVLGLVVALLLVAVAALVYHKKHGQKKHGPTKAA